MCRLQPAADRHDGLHDSWSIRLGTSRTWTTGTRALVARAGVAWDSAAPAQRVDDVAVAPGAPRAQPDVPVPLVPSNRQPYHPYNAGRDDSASWILATGVTVSW